MSTDHLLYETIDLYLKGELSEDELYAFEIRLAKDESLREMVDTQRIANKVVYTGQLIALQAKIQSDLTRQVRWKGYRSFLWIGLIAAGIATVLYFPKPKEKTTSIQTIAPTLITTTGTTVNNISNQNSAEFKKVSPVIDASQVVSSDKSDTTDSGPTIQKEIITRSLITESKSNYPPEPAHIIEEQKTDCSTLEAENAFSAIPACADEQDGKISINQSKILGGKAPYSYSFNRKDKYTSANDFQYLAPGMYTVYIKDAKNCVVQKDIEVTEKPCRKSNVFAFTPELEKWKVPVKQNKSGVLKIFNKSGILVYTSDVSSDGESYWDGTATDGQILETGYYPYQISYPDGETEIGSVSIMRQ